MKKVLLFIFYLTCFLYTFSQAELEILDYGWGPGVIDFKACYADLDKDGLLDMLVSDRYWRMMHYEQIEPNSYSFTLINKKFNNNTFFDWIDHPLLIDIDRDSLLDLVIGSANFLYHYEQTSPTSYSFDSIALNFSGIETGSFVRPCIADIDHDGLYDLLIGTDSGLGQLWHYEQTDPHSDSFQWITYSFTGIPYNVWDRIALEDIDHDGLMDLILADGSWDYPIRVYEQVSPDSYEFVFVTDNFLPDHQPVNPEFYDIDGDSLLDVVIDSRLHYEQSDYHSYDLVCISRDFLKCGYYTAIADIDHDGLTDIFTSYNGHYEESPDNPLKYDLVSDENIVNVPEYWDYFSPALTDFNGDGVFDLLFGNQDGTMAWYQQEAYNSDHFVLVCENFCNIDVDIDCCPFFFDIDSDGLLDLLIGSNYKLSHYEQETGQSSVFNFVTDNFVDYNFDFYNVPTITDLDNDTLLDLILGGDASWMYRFEQTEKDSYNFTYKSNSILNEPFWGITIAASFHDFDGNGTQDLLVGELLGGLQMYLLQPVPYIITQPGEIEVCEGQPVKLSVKADGAPPLAFQWKKNGVDIPLANDSVYLIAAAQITDNGVYECMISNGYGSIISNPADVAINYNPEAAFTFSLPCSFRPVYFTNMSHVQSGIILNQIWNFGDGISSGLENPSHVYQESGNYLVNLIVETEAGCTNSITSPVEIFDNPVADFSSSLVCRPDSSVFLDESFISAGFIADWLWDFGNFSFSYQQNPKYKFEQAGDHVVTLTALSDHNCSDTVQKTITVQEISSSYTCTNPCSNPEGTMFNNTSVLSGSGNLLSNWLISEVEYSGDSAFLVFFSVPGSYEISLYNSSEVCSDTLSGEITIYNPAVISLDTLFKVCKSGPPLQLTGGSPIGGYYDGNAVQDGYFYPTVAGTGKHEITYIFIDSNTCINKTNREIEVSDCVIPEGSCGDWINLFPNPAEKWIQFFTNTDCKNLNLAIYNSFGQMVLHNSFSNIKGNTFYYLSIGDFAESGVYYFKFQTAGQQSICKIIIESNH
jgi:PKD repeat protein